MIMAGCTFLCWKLIPHNVIYVVCYSRLSSNQMVAQSIDALLIGFTQPGLVNQDTIMVQVRFVLDATIATGKGIDKQIRSAQCVELQRLSGASCANIKAIGS